MQDHTRKIQVKERKRNEHTQTKCISKYPRTHWTNITRWVSSEHRNKEQQKNANRLERNVYMHVIWGTFQYYRVEMEFSAFVRLLYLSLNESYSRTRTRHQLTKKHQRKQQQHLKQKMKKKSPQVFSRSLNKDTFYDEIWATVCCCCCVSFFRLDFCVNIFMVYIYLFSLLSTFYQHSSFTCAFLFFVNLAFVFMFI